MANVATIETFTNHAHASDRAVNSNFGTQNAESISPCKKGAKNRQIIVRKLNPNPPAEKANLAAIVAKWTQTPAQQAAIRARWAALPSGSVLNLDSGVWEISCSSENEARDLKAPHGDIFPQESSIKLGFHGENGVGPEKPTTEQNSTVAATVDTRPRLLDLFCGAGGAAKGYQLAGFHVTGVDLKNQPRYCGDVFIQADALEYLAAHGHEFDVIHASPPCQAYSVAKTLTTAEYPKLIAEVRQMLIATGKPYVIENVAGAKKDMLNPLMLCGTMFDLNVIRHRLFEINPPVYFPPACCSHYKKTAKRGEYDTGHNGYITVAGHNFNREFAAQAMGIDWMNTHELAESIPPAYTKFIGDHLMAHITRKPDPVAAGERTSGLVAVGYVDNDGVKITKGSLS